MIDDRLVLTRSVSHPLQTLAALISSIAYLIQYRFFMPIILASDGLVFGW